MATIRFFESPEHAFVPTHELAPPGGSIGEAEREGTSVRFHHPGSESEAQMFEVECKPNIELPVHAHGKDEIIVVIAGELRFGRRVCGVGSSVYIPGYTAYGFSTGPEGATFLNFRPSADPVYLTRDELLAKKKAGELPD
jgi:hypothetical protein